MQEGCVSLVYILFLGLVTGLSGQEKSKVDKFNFTRGVDCVRKCDGIPKNCYFKLTVERYPVLGGACRDCIRGIKEDCFLPQCVTANGHFRPFISVNRQLPAPAIHVCRGDRLTVDIHNNMPDETTSIHWHGISQNGSQYYDGVPYVTQCPILPGTKFRYSFIADHAGTYFYHSHTAIQKLDGLNGALIVREIEQEETLSSLYDEDLPEHAIVIQDWTNFPGEAYLPGFNNEFISQGPDSYLINGRGIHYSNTSNIELPLAEFVVEKGKRYRFRLIGSTCLTCAASLKFQGHRVLAITSDGGLKFKPVAVDTVALNAADRFDVVLEANQTEGIYYISVQNGINGNCDDIRQVGILRYKTIDKPSVVELPPLLTIEQFGVVLNAVNSSCDGTNSNEICVSMLEGVENAIENNSSQSYQQIPISFSFYDFTDTDLFRNGTYQRYDEPVKGLRKIGLINNVSFAFPPSAVISQFSDIPSDSFCDEKCYKSTVQKCCSCTNIYSIPFGAVVDLIIYDGDDSGFDHPFHLHGFNFYVLETGVFREDKKTALASLSRKLKEDNLNLKNRPMKDSISVPSGGYVLARFIADNPGFWFFHCHFVFHLEAGMAALFKVGNENQLPPIPPKFPTCGNF